MAATSALCLLSLNSSIAIPKVRGCQSRGPCLCYTKAVSSSVPALQGVVLREARVPQRG